MPAFSKFIVSYSLICILGFLANGQSLDHNERIELFQPVKKYIGKSDSAYLIFDSLMDRHAGLESRLHFYSLIVEELTQAGLYDESLQYAYQGLEVGYQSQSAYLYYGNIMRFIITVYLRKSNYDSAIYYADKFASKSKSMNHQQHLVSAYIQKWAIYDEVGDYNSGLEELNKALVVAEEIGDPYHIAKVYTNLSIVYDNLGEEEKSIYYGKKLLAYYTEENKYMNIAQSGNNLGLAYISIDRFDSAQLVLNAALKASEKIQSQFGINLTKLNMAVNFYHQKKYQQAIDLIRAVYDFFDDSGDDFGLMICDFNYCRIYAAMGDYDQSVMFGEKAYKNAKENQLLYKQPDLLTALSKSNERIKKTDRALELIQEYVITQDSIRSDERNREIGRLESRIDLEKAKSENNALQKETALQNEMLKVNQRILLIVLVALGLLSILLIVLFRLNRRLKNSTRLIEEQSRQLKEVMENQKHWFVNISHELKTPLTLIKGPIEKLIREDNVREQGKDDIALAGRNVDRLSEIVYEILDISKIEEGMLALMTRPVNLTALIHRSVAAFDSYAKGKNVEVQMDLPDRMVVNVDESKMQKIITNLMSNALKFTHAGGKVMISLTQTEEHIIMKVLDTGEGIREEDHPYIFDRFYQTNNQRNQRQGGTGIGLSLTRELVVMHGGSIELSSQIGKGSTFSILLPLDLLGYQGSPDLSMDMDDPMVDQLSYKSRLETRPKVLLVEDNQDMRSYIKGLIAGYCQVIEAVDGVDGLVQLENDPPDLIISDVMMPRLDGIELAKQVKQNREWANIPFITLTALSSDEDKVLVLRIGVDDYITKPFNAEELRVRIENLISNRKNREAASHFDENGSYDDEILQMLEQEVMDHMTEAFLSVSYLAEKVSMSERKLQRYVKKQTGFTPLQFINELRMLRALKLLEKKSFPTISEVSHAVGIDTPTYFSEQFKSRFGRHPKDYLG
jgi:signal transduction histidine kinase/DNA-binding response OmpR family regulator